MKWICDNIQWVFSGIGIFIFSVIYHFLFKRKKSSLHQVQESGHNSVNFQAKGDIKNVKIDR